MLQYSKSDYHTMPDQNELTKKQLASLLKDERAVLMVGAGSSKFVGYPLWDELVNEMGRKLAPSLRRSKNVAPTEYADMIKDQLKREARIEDYYNFLEKKFEPRRNAKNHEDFHLALAQFAFCGIVTTNYDLVLETAVMEAYTNENGPFLCEALDLCQERPYSVFDFLRGLSLHRDHRWILHLHGYCRNPKAIILTRTDYKTKYGEQPTSDEYGKPLNRVLDSLHRKVLWSLFAMHSLVFVGFSMADEFFIHMLGVVQADFELGSDPAHFAIMPYTSANDREKTSLILQRKGVLPVFYQVPEPKSSNESPDHSGLEKLVFELADSVGVSIGSPSIISLTKKMLER